MRNRLPHPVNKFGRYAAAQLFAESAAVREIPGVIGVGFLANNIKTIILINSSYIDAAATQPVKGNPDSRLLPAPRQRTAIGQEIMI